MCIGGLKQRPFSYSEIFVHPPLAGSAFEGGHIKDDVPYTTARVCKNESNSTVFLSDGTWLTTWSQGSHEGHPDERIVAALSRDMGATWSSPRTIVESVPEDEERAAYGIPFVVPRTDRIYLFYFITANTEGKLWAREQRLAPSLRRYPEHAAGKLHFVFSDDRGQTWSARAAVDLPPRDSNTFADRWHGWVNHPPQQMPTGEVVFTFGSHPMTQMSRRAWQLSAAEVSLVRCDNILSETDPEALRFTLLPQGPRGIRTDPRSAWNSPALRRLLARFDGTPSETAHNFQEMTLVALEDGRWVGVGRSFLGSPAFTVSGDRGQTWSAALPLCYGAAAPAIRHPMTMCPIAPTGDGRYVLLFTNNDGSQRGAAHVWDGDGRTRNPQWFAVARGVPGQERNGGLVFGEPRLLVEVDDGGEVNLKTGISMPQFIARDGRYFVAYNINKEQILLDEIPAGVLDTMTPPLP
jgi:hypothetical protein